MTRKDSPLNLLTPQKFWVLLFLILVMPPAIPTCPGSFPLSVPPATVLLPALLPSPSLFAEPVDIELLSRALPTPGTAVFR